MHRPTAARNAAAVVTVDSDQNQLRRDLNSLRRNVHELCTRSATGFDCNRFLDSTDRRFIDNTTDRAPAAVVVKTTTAGQNLICDKV